MCCRGTVSPSSSNLSKEHEQDLVATLIQNTWSTLFRKTLNLQVQAEMWSELKIEWKKSIWACRTTRWVQGQSKRVVIKVAQALIMQRLVHSDAVIHLIAII